MFDTTQNNFLRLRDNFAQKTRQIVVWTGAGLSAPASLPTWVEFRDKLITRAEKSLVEVQFTTQQLSHNQALIQLSKTEQSFWKSFTYIAEVLGESTYAETVRSVFRSGERCSVPQNYIEILKLKPTGIITTNIDRLVSRALQENMHHLNLGSLPLDFTGRECKDFMHALDGTRFFILNLHGIFEKRGSWVFQLEDLKQLMEDTSYKSFVETCFLSKTIVFIGATVDDISITTHLDKILTGEANTAPHFWITVDRSAGTRSFCEKYNILPIYYDSSQDHAELKEIIAELNTYKAVDVRIERPVTPAERTIERSVRHFEDIDLSSLPLNELRKVLNRKAQAILASDNSEAYLRYHDFRKQHSRYVHNSWHVDPPDNQLFEFELADEIDDGAFGRVFMATDSDRNTVAVKLLKEDVMRKDDWLQAFRRGVKAMQILNKRNIAGMVKYISASEIPTFVAMEYVDGINLKKAIETQQLQEWYDILRLLCEISGIIAKAHGLPERVLHRDIRPPNIMLRGFDYSSDEWSVCVLDFDLAFHKGANEVSIQPSSDMNGFLAPEQIEPHSIYTTRSALVDSYGIAMLIYYVISRKAPKPSQSLHADWGKILQCEIASKRCKEWESLPLRIARVIEQCTRYEQSQRLDMTQIHGSLCALRKAYLDAKSVNDGELLAEELATRISNRLECIAPVSWNSNKVEASLICNSGEKITVKSTSDGIHVVVRWINDGTTKYEIVRNTVGDATTAAKTRFAKKGFSVTSTCDDSGASLDGTFTNRNVCLRMNDLVDLFALAKIAPKNY